VTVIDPKTNSHIELNPGLYELKLVEGEPGLRLSAETLTLRRGHKTVVTVRREPPAPPSAPKPPAERPADPRAVSLIARFQSPHDNVHFGSLLPDGRRVAYVTGGDLQNDKWVAGNDPALWVGDLADPGNPRKLMGHTQDVAGLAISKDGLRALTTSKDGTLRLWDLETGKSRVVRREAAGLAGVAFSPDERRAAYVGGDTIHLCDLKTGDELMTFRGYRGRQALAFCADGRRLVSAGPDDPTICVWDVVTGEKIRVMRHGNHVHGLAVFPDDRRALTGSCDRTIGVWDLETGQQLRRITGVANGDGASVAVSPDGRRALFGVDNTIRLWDLETGGEVERLEGHTAGAWQVAFSPDGRRAVSSSIDKTVRVWELPPGRAPGEQPPVTEVAHLLGHRAVVEMAVVAPDGRRVLTGSADKAVILWDRESGQEIRRLAGHEGWVVSVAVSPDGRRALSGGEDKVVRLWDLGSGRIVREFKGHTEWVFGVAFSPDGRLAYSTSGGSWPGWKDGTDSAVRVWDVETGRRVGRLVGHKGIVFSLCASPDGRRVLTGGSDMAPILWDAKTGAEARRLRGHTGTVECVALLPEGRHALSGGIDRTIRLWDLETGQEVYCFRGHPNRVTGLAVSPDGRRLLSSDYDGHELRLWDLRTRQMVHRINWGNSAPTRGSFTPDGRHAVWGGKDGVVRVYRLPTPDQDKTERPDAPGQTAAGAPAVSGTTR
jgi:WD40 repeat protein